MSDNAPLMALIRSEFKKLKDSIDQQATAATLPHDLADRLDAIEKVQAEVLRELTRRTALIARAIGIIHAELPNSEPLSEDLLRDELFRDHMENYPANAAPAYNVAKLEALVSEISTWPDDLVAARKVEKLAELESRALDPLDAYKARVVIDRLLEEERRRADRELSKDAVPERER